MQHRSPLRVLVRRWTRPLRGRIPWYDSSEDAETYCQGAGNGTPNSWGTLNACGANACIRGCLIGSAGGNGCGDGIDTGGDQFDRIFCNEDKTQLLDCAFRLGTTWYNAKSDL